MSQQLISRNEDLQRLSDDGYKIAIEAGHLFVMEIPYVNSKREVHRGTLVAELNISGEKVLPPKNHTVHFAGEHPCKANGEILSAIKHSSQDIKKGSITVNHMFSNKPKGEKYTNHYDKIVRYIEIIEPEARAIEEGVTARAKAKDSSVRIIQDEAFVYFDANANLAEITDINDKLRGQKVAIVGLGGTGAYVLDLVSKAPVGEIHLFDGDKFIQKNAFRAPGAAPKETFDEEVFKCDYYQSIYSKMKIGIVVHNEYICDENLHELQGMDFVFLNMDTSEVKRKVVDFLLGQKIPFVESGIGVNRVKGKDQLIGVLRSTFVTAEKSDHVSKRISFAADPENEYNTNIQVAELNVFNACLAVIRWKKYFGFYNDASEEFNTTFSINDNNLVSDDYKT